MRSFRVEELLPHVVVWLTPHAVPDDDEEVLVLADGVSMPGRVTGFQHVLGRPQEIKVTIALAERRRAQRRSQANTARSEMLPQRRSWEDRRAGEQ